MSGSIPSWAVRGAKVVCVRLDTEQNDYPDLPSPIVGGIYTVGRVGRIRGYGRPIIGLVELPLRDPSDGGELGFWAECFRPLITKSLEQDSTMFRKLLQPKRVRGRVDA